MTTEAIDLQTPRACLTCKGTGSTHSKWAKENGYEGPEGKPCFACSGKGTFEGFDVKTLVDIVLTTKGKTRTFRKSFPSKLKRFKDLNAGRAYYVWRLARFHGGADVTMPMTAGLVTHGDPFKKELDLLADEVAEMAFGTKMAAAVRWGQALGYIQEAPKGLPASAYSNGPVTDDNKPEWEQLELR